MTVEMPIVFRLFWIAPMLAGALLAVSAAKDLMRAEESAMWIATDAEVTRVGGQRGIFVTKAWGTYQWYGAGQLQTGSEVACCGRNWSDYFEAHGERKVGDKVTVFVNPDNPADAVLMSGKSVGCYLPIGVGAALIAAGVFLRRRILADNAGTTSRGM